MSVPEKARHRLAAPVGAGAGGPDVAHRSEAAHSSDVAVRGLLHAAVVTARPRQWVKNLLVVAAAGAAGALGNDDVPGRVLLALGAFCLLASGTYFLNDVHDAAEDRHHPRKCRRPVAAGELSTTEAMSIGAVMLATGLLVCASLSGLLAVVGFAYVALTLSYTLLWRRVILLDLVAIAGGFVLRAAAGGAAAPVDLSEWFVLVVCFAALFVAAGKRHAECVRALRGDRARRSVLRRYSPRGLRAVLALSGAGALLAYAGWALAVSAPGGVWRPLTLIPFALGFLRYWQILGAGGGEAPEEVVFDDLPLACAGVAWLALFVLSVNAGS